MGLKPFSKSDTATGIPTCVVLTNCDLGRNAELVIGCNLLACFLIFNSYSLFLNLY